MPSLSHTLDEEYRIGSDCYICRSCIHNRHAIIVAAIVVNERSHANVIRRIGCRWSCDHSRLGKDIPTQCQSQLDWSASSRAGNITAEAHLVDSARGTELNRSGVLPKALRTTPSLKEYSIESKGLPGSNGLGSRIR